MLKKIVFPLVIVLVLAGTMSAASYTALVTNKVDPDIVGTGSANLAFYSAGGAVADAFISTDGLHALQIKLDFGDIQPHSTYQWDGCLVVKNNESFGVSLTVDSITGDLVNNVLPQAPDGAISMTSLIVWGNEGASYEYWNMWMNVAGYGTRDANPNYSWAISIPAGGTRLISFKLITSENESAHTAGDSWITFKAVASA